MNLNRFNFTALIATLVLLLAACSQLSNPPRSEEPEVSVQLFLGSITTITSHDPNPSVQGQAVVVKFKVENTSFRTPRGNVIVGDGVDSCVGVLASTATDGLATGECSITLNTVGTRSLSAAYTSTNSLSPSTSPSLDHTVNPSDTTAPTASPTQSPAANSAGWNNSDVTVNWNWSDAGTGIDDASCTKTSTSSGEGTIKLTATCKDKAGNEGSAEYTVKVDKTAPTCTASVNRVSLWSPNHKLTDITTTVSVSDTNADGFMLKSVSSSEADSGLGTDDVPNDIQGWALNTADIAGQLRSERYSKNGRTYTITYEAKDKAGNTAECKASVSVPKSQGK